MDKDDKIPKYTYDLITTLDREFEAPPLPKTAAGWINMDEARSRELAFIAGQRAMVDMLVNWMNESEGDTDVENPVNSTGPEAFETEFGRVLDEGLSKSTVVAPLRVAEVSLGTRVDTDDHEG